MSTLISHIKTWWALHATWILSALYWFVPSIQSWITAHPKSAFAGVLGMLVAALLKQSPIKPAAVVLLLMLLSPTSGIAQVTTPVPADIPVTHVTISGSFTGYDSNGKMVPATIDTFGVAVYRNTAATRGFDANYKHIAVPQLGQRWELGEGCFWISLPKVPNLLFDTSNFVSTSCAGAGKFLSSVDGNRLAYTLSQSITYPIAGHMAWTISYDYNRATGGIAGVVNKSFSSIGTGPQIHF
jgi:hypothetical protein